MAHQHLFVNHEEIHKIKCNCGKIITYGEYYLFKRSLSSEYVTECTGYECKMCMKYLFEGQWMIALDKSIVCSYCDTKCIEKLPKDCTCQFFIDSKGVDRCKICNAVYGLRYPGYYQHKCKTMV